MKHAVNTSTSPGIRNAAEMKHAVNTSTSPGIRNAAEMKVFS
jgi:hypothetical protein